ncbi:protein PGR-like [Ananas comosus]|uniref:Protein PGR-like n=1 Tax=Ananas comosus TaxID=4615 RepID=A0A199W7Q2_ANACO|nr:protein PGR-like [Ananas comosus]OAY85487.1 Transmembrane protein 19 [Ananas comosus]
MDPLAIRFLVSLLASSAIAARSFRRRSVDLSGVLVGIPVMVIHMTAGYRFAALLLVFFFTSSKLTRVGEERKRAIDVEFKEGGQRNWVQVLANSGIATVLVVIVAFLTGGQDRCLDTKESNYVTGLIGGIIGHYACCNGDTWSSELGILSRGQPRLITNFKKVRKGTNGAVTVDGFLAAAAAGFVIGLTFVLVGFLTSECAPKIARRQLLVVPIAAAAGLCGSLIDSLLGATLQFSGYCTLRKKVVANPGPTVSKISGRNILDNHGVNVVSVLLTTLLTAIACLYIF